jgi:chromosome segregation ATPase
MVDMTHTPNSTELAMREAQRHTATLRGAIKGWATPGELAQRIGELERGLAEMVDAGILAAAELERRGTRTAELEAELRETRTALRSARADFETERDAKLTARARIAELENELGVAGEAQDERRAR